MKAPSKARAMRPSNKIDQSILSENRGILHSIERRTLLRGVAQPRCPHYAHRV